MSSEKDWNKVIKQAVSDYQENLGISSSWAENELNKKLVSYKLRHVESNVTRKIKDMTGHDINMQALCKDNINDATISFSTYMDNWNTEVCSIRLFDIEYGIGNREALFALNEEQLEGYIFQMFTDAMLAKYRERNKQSLIDSIIDSVVDNNKE